MRLYWLQDNETKNNVNIYWKKGKDETDPNKADYQTKHHPIIHHRGVRNTYVMDAK